MKKLEVKKFGIEREDKSRLMESWESEIKTLTEKINEIIEVINKIKL